MTAIHSSKIEGCPRLEGLPNSFVCSMRTLFDIMDDDQLGYIKFSEIERRWQEDITQGLPDGVLESLRKVTPPNGFLSFDRFCAGLKMCLIRNKEHGDNGALIPDSFDYTSPSRTPFTSANSLEAIPPLKASSPQTSPQRRVRPLSAPLLDQEIMPKLPLTNGNLITSISVNCKTVSGASLPKGTKTSAFRQDYSSNYHTISTYHPIPNESKIYGTKSDIKMGIGGIKGMSKSPHGVVCSTFTGPPKPPRAKEVASDAHFNYRRRSSNSLDRESRPDKREKSNQDDGGRKGRGSSLERLLDCDREKEPKEKAYSRPLNRTGMRSALQLWFRERSKSDLQKGDSNNNYGPKGGGSRYAESLYENSRITNCPVVMDTAFRGIGDGGDSSHRGLSRASNNAPVYTRKDSLSTLPTNDTPAAPHPLSTEEYIYGMTMEKVQAVPAISSAGYSSSNFRAPIDSEFHAMGGVPAAAAQGMYVAPQPPQIAVHKKTSKKKEPRRRTLPNGIDHNGMKRLRQLEAERDMLYQGLDVVEKAKTWYKIRLQDLTERMHYLPLESDHTESSFETEREKLHFQLARIHEINAHLSALMDAHDKGLPTHMNLAIRSPLTVQKRTMERIKEQNKLLTDEVSDKSERITNLEREKAALFRELFQARASQRSTIPADSTFM